MHGLERIFQTYTKEELNLVPSGESFRICGVVEELSKRISKKNNKAWLSFVLSTKDSRYDLQLFSEAFDTYHSLIQEGALLVVEGTIRRTDTELRFNTLRVYDFQTQFPRMVKQCHWILYDNEFTQNFLNRMQKQICDCSGNMEVKISFFYNDDYAIEGELPMCCKTYFSLDLIAELLKHKAVYALEVTPTEIAPFPGREGRNFSRGNFS